MKFQSPLVEGTMIKRYKRFFADVEVDGKTVTAHVPNTGSLKSCLYPQQKAYLLPADNPDRKLKFTLQMLEVPNGLVGVNTQIPNQLIRSLITENPLPQWKTFDRCQPEFKINAETRVDFMLENTVSKKRHYIEVKNVSLQDKGVALFPDAETTRGQKHLRELMELKSQGHGAEIVFVIQRTDVKSFSVAFDIDPVYGELLKKCENSGVLITPLVCDLNVKGIEINGRVLPLNWDFLSRGNE